MKSPLSAFTQLLFIFIINILHHPIEAASSKTLPIKSKISLNSTKEIPIAKVPFKKPQEEKITIVIDAGHGGDDFGTHSLGSPKYQEKYLNMSTALLVKSFLQKFGYKVLLTRTDDTFIPLDKRALFANDKNSRLFVSIHYNSAPNKDAEGIEIFFYRNQECQQRSVQSKQLAQYILDKIIQNTNAKSRGVKHGNYAVLRETKMPAVLIEGGFLTSTKEMEKIKDPTYLKSLALGIAQGVQNYLAKEKILAER